MNATIFGTALAAVFVLGTVTLGASVFADSSLEFIGDYKGAVRSGNEHSGFFVDTGTYTLFEGISVAKGHYEITLDDSLPCGGSAALEYTIKDRNDNAMSFVDEEVSCYMLDDNHLVSLSEWTVVDGDGKFEGATGTGYSMTIIEMRTFTYHGEMVGEISLTS